MANGKLTKKVRKKLGLPSSTPTRIPKSNPAKMQVLPSGKGCCGKNK